MELDPDDVFRDDDDDPENEFYQERNAGKELVVYLVDASPKMFGTTCLGENEKEETHFHVAVSCIAQSLKTQIINRSYDEIAICFFNTREKKNLQDLNGVYVYNVVERDDLDRPTARLIKEFDSIEESFTKEIRSQYGILSGSRDNSLYNALWVAQALLRKGSAKTADKRILLLTNEDDPFGSIKGITKIDMMRTTLQRAKDAQDLGISIELLPLSRPDEEFNVSLFYAELLGLEGDDLTQFLISAGERFEDMKDQLRKRMFKKRKVRRITFSIANGISIELNTYALIRPTFPGTITWLDSLTNVPLKTERSFLCADTGALVQEPAKRFQSYKNEDIKFSVEELSEIKRVSTGHLRLLGFKPLSCLKDYHNLRPSTFVFPSDEEVVGSTCIFIALHRSMLRLKRFAVAFYGSSTHPQLVALVAQDEIITAGGQVEPPGMHMIYLPYSDDIRQIEEIHSDIYSATPRANDDQVNKATALMRRIDLKDFSVCQFSNPALQRHYAVLQALALDEDEMPEIKDETVPDEEGMARTGVVNALEEFKHSVYGENFDEEHEFETKGKVSEASRKRKAISENAVKECANYDWLDLAETGKLKDLTVVELKYYLTANNLPVTGKKEALINRILVHMGK
ncbi:ATP-dependent DNA helicase 2 subunit like [Actinidia chinensis var. chinensis]|uniref:ATP-dependent DNA helicase 2 subunit KU70 n=1 Tax=Actinidia chinensis var. chinensis TaxID=1590841 RepID=A0A2R6S0W0_ACTCC|nr:ATP-dependent DNA helicase 2 subunit like [Actinidia chinensis var. chinensis]